MTDHQIPKAAVIGWPVSHSLSPRLHGYWLKHYGLEGSYAALAVTPDELSVTLKGLHGQGFRGVNLTVPHKETALRLVDRLDPLAKQVGAVNMVIVGNDGRLEGRNSDVFGFRENLTAGGFTATDRPVILLGAGGAARAAVAALIELDCLNIRLVNRTVDKAEALAADFPTADIRIFAWGDQRALEDGALLANATSLGLQGQPALKIDLQKLPPDALVTDMVYVPLQTGLLTQASHRGLKTIDGLGMLLHQARPAFKAFFGIDPEVTVELRENLLMIA